MSSLSPILMISKNELVRIIRNPIVVALLIFLLMFALLDSMGGASQLKKYDDPGKNIFNDIFINIGLSNNLYTTLFLCTIIAVFIGAMSTVEERSSGSLNLLLIKPLYRRDIVLGKLAGLNIFMLLVICIYLVFYSLLLMVFFRAPYSFDFFLIRFLTLIFLLFSGCSLSIAVSMFLGLVFKNILNVSLMAVTFLYIQFYGYLSMGLDIFSWIMPKDLVSNAIGSSIFLLNPSIPYEIWFFNSLSYIVLIVLGTLMFSVINCYISIRSWDA